LPDEEDLDKNFVDDDILYA